MELLQHNPLSKRTSTSQRTSSWTNTSKVKEKLMISLEMMHSTERQRVKKVSFTKSMVAILMPSMVIFPQTLTIDPCNTADFPKLFGSNNNDNNFLQIDAHLDKNAICAAGNTKDG